MTKKIISASVIFVIVAALSIALYFLSQPVEQKPAENPVTPEEIHYVLGSAEPVLVKSFDVINKKASFSVDVSKPEAERLERGYSIRTMENLPALRYSLSAMADAAEKTTARMLISENKSDFPIYGLDKPQATVDIRYVDGSAAKLLIGNEAPGSEGFYVTASDKVYLVSSSSLSGFLSSPLTFMDKTVTPGDPEQDQFTKVTLGGTIRPEPINIDPAPSSDSQVVLASHVITSPVNAAVDTERGVKAICSSFGLYADEVTGIKTNPGDLEMLGLVEPYSTIKINSVDNGVIEIFSSAPDANGDINIMTNKSDLIYKLNASVLTWLDAQVYDIMARLAVLPNIDTVSDITVMLYGEVYKFELYGEGNDLVVKINGSEPSVANFRKLYQNLLSASFDLPSTEAFPEDAEPIASFTYAYRDNSKAPEVVKFFKGPPRRNFITANDGTPYLISTTYLEKITSDIPGFLAGEEISTFF